MIVGNNAIKQLIHLMKKSEDYWRLLAAPVDIADDDCSQFSSLLSNSEKWRGGPIPDKIGTIKLRQSVTLEPLCEHLVCLPLHFCQWGVQLLSNQLSQDQGPEIYWLAVLSHLCGAMGGYP